LEEEEEEEEDEEVEEVEEVGYKRNCSVLCGAIRSEPPN